MTVSGQPAPLDEAVLAAGDFREGTRSMDEGVMNEFKPGLWHLGKKHPDAELVPVHLDGQPRFPFGTRLCSSAPRLPTFRWRPAFSLLGRPDELSRRPRARLTDSFDSFFCLLAMVVPFGGFCPAQPVWFLWFRQLSV